MERERREPDETVLGQVIHGWIKALVDRALQTYHGELPRYELGCMASARVLISCPCPFPARGAENLARRKQRFATVRMLSAMVQKLKTRAPRKTRRSQPG